MRRNENDNSSSLNWRTATKEGSTTTDGSRRNTNQNRQRPTIESNWRVREGSTTTDGSRRNTNQTRQRPTIESNWRVREGPSSFDNCCESDTASYEHITRHYEGSWIFRVDDEEKENVIEVLQQLHNDNPSLFVKPPSQMGKKKKGLTPIECPTADSRDVDTVRNVAKTIHNVVDHPYGVYYYYGGVARYFFLQDVLFESVKKENSVGWISIEEKTPSSITDQVSDISLDDKAEYTSTDLPSNVTDRRCLFYPSEATVENLPSQAGKWMLYGSKDLSKMDSYWKKLKPLCDKGVVAALKSSTVADKRGGVIRAYTNDCENMEEVSLAGEAILEETGYSEIMFYKTNEASKEGSYIHEGKQNISLYLHAGKSKFCSRDQYDRWKLRQGM